MSSTSFLHYSLIPVFPLSLLASGGSAEFAVDSNILLQGLFSRHAWIIIDAQILAGELRATPALSLRNIVAIFPGGIIASTTLISKGAASKGKMP
jgi:hypothetical protein